MAAVEGAAEDLRRSPDQRARQDGWGSIETRELDPDRKLNIARPLAVFLNDLDCNLPRVKAKR
jgi:hypothetical protein